MKYWDNNLNLKQFFGFIEIFFFIFDKLKDFQ